MFGLAFILRIGRPSAKYLEPLPVNAEAPGTGDRVQDIMDTVAVELMESDDLWKNRAVDEELTELWMMWLTEIKY